MILARRARKIAAAAVYGGGGLTVLGAATLALLFAEARLARRIVGIPEDAEEMAPPADGTYGDGTGVPLSFVMMGDSSAAGYGVGLADQTPAVMLAMGLSSVAGRPVRLTNVAVSGALSKDLEPQTDLALRAEPELAVVFIGGNDVTSRVKPSTAVAHLDHTVRRLHEAGCEVTVGTCPDLGTVKPIAQPLKWLARRWSRQIAAAQMIGVVEAGGRSVSLGNLLGPDFEANPAELFGPDQFHPSEQGYAAAAAAVLPSLCAALGLWPESDELPDGRRGEGVLPIYLAAAEAVEEPGTEVTGTRVAGRDRGPRGRWAMLLRRRQHELSTSGEGPRETVGNHTSQPPHG